MNFIIIGIFASTLCYTVLNYSTLMAQASISPLTSMFFPIMLIISLCMVYFFGFFGISFLDTQELSESPSSFGLADLQKEAEAKEAAKKAALSTVAHQPRNDTPICAERGFIAPTPAVSTSKVLTYAYIFHLYITISHIHVYST